MKTQIKGVEYDNETTISQIVEQLKEKGEFEETADGFKMNITKQKEPTAQELLNEMALDPFSLSYWKNTRHLKESSYFLYSYTQQGATNKASHLHFPCCVSNFHFKAERRASINPLHDFNKDALRCENIQKMKGGKA
jgi:hypothetical protein